MDQIEIEQSNPESQYFEKTKKLTPIKYPQKTRFLSRIRISQM